MHENILYQFVTKVTMEIHHSCTILYAKWDSVFFFCSPELFLFNFTEVSIFKRIFFWGESCFYILV